MSGESVRVAVRVRPFNSREKDRKAKCVLEMKDKSTIITNPDGGEKKDFAFDYSYWSHDAFKELADGTLEPDGPGSNYSSQRRVFEDLGQGVLDNAFQGYNCSLFAYGQTGAGKSYSMVGYSVNKGIVPITCDELFKSTKKNEDPNKRFEITFSMLEIYNEQVRDLLSKDSPKGGLPVRQNPKLGLFYVQGLKNVPVGSYEEIEKRMEQGTANRTVASTQMNATSSRAHTVVTIIFDQISKNPQGQETKKSSTINLVDLAGSERADSTGATGDRLKEGANINKSLSALGNVISALADLSMGKKKVMVPYRDSVLTKLLQNALGGNSKTIMIAALSPADINYDETLGTLRYADRAKKIKNKATVNENPMDKLIRELKEENDRLKKAMDGGGIVTMTGLTPEEKEKMRKEMEEEIRQNMATLASSEEGWEQKLQAARSESFAQDNSRDRRATDPHLLNLNEDPMLSGVVTHFLEASDTTIGRKDAAVMPNISLSGLSILKEHAVISLDNGDYVVKPGSTGAKTKLNGAPLTGPTTLGHKDRLLFGSNHLYVFINPKKTDCDSSLPPNIDWDFAQKEIAQAKGFATGGDGLTKDQQLAQEAVLELLPMVSEVNAISEELDKHKTFEVVLISAAAQEGNFSSTKGTKTMVKMKDLRNSNTWMWERGKFLNRRFLMQDMYQSFLDGNLDQIPKEEDPFWEPTENVLIGTANVFLQALGYSLDLDDCLTVTDYKGQDEGRIFINVSPCTQKGKSLDEDHFVDSPEELLEKPYWFKITINSAEINKARFVHGSMIKYKVYDEVEYRCTEMKKSTLTPEFKHTEIIHFEKITQEHLDFFETGCITFSLYGIQEDSEPDPKLAKMTTKELRQMEHIQKPGRNTTSFAIDNGGEASSMKNDYIVLSRKYERLASKELRLVQMVKEWGEKPANQKEFTPFYNAVSALANSTGTKLKTRVKVLQNVLANKKIEATAKGEAKVNGAAGGGAKDEQKGSKACVIQ